MFGFSSIVKNIIARKAFRLCISGFFLWTCFSSFAAEDSIEDIFLAGVAYQEQQQWAHAIKNFKIVVKQRPQQFRVYNRIGFCFEQLGYHDIAADYYHKTISYDPQNEFARQRLKNFVENKLLQNSSVSTEISEKRQKKEQAADNLNRSISSAQRLWFTRQGLLYTMQRDGRNLSLFSPGVVGEIFPRISNVGFSAIVPDLEQIEKQDNIDSESELEKQLYFFDFRKNDFIHLANVQLAQPEPFHFADWDAVLFRNRKPDGQSGLFYVRLKEPLQSHGLLTELDHIAHISYDENTKFLYFSGVEQLGNGNAKTFRWNLQEGTEYERLTYGPGDEDNLMVSPNGKFLLCRRRNSDGQYNLVVVDLTNRSSFQISFFNSNLLEAVWSYDSSQIFFSSSVHAAQEGLSTMAGWINLETKFITDVFSSNFRVYNLILDELEDYVYYLTDYDNNTEIYRWNFSKSLPERLTISDENEVQLGFWQFSVY